VGTDIGSGGALLDVKAEKVKANGEISPHQEQTDCNSDRRWGKRVQLTVITTGSRGECPSLESIGRHLFPWVELEAGILVGCRASRLRCLTLVGCIMGKTPILAHFPQLEQRIIVYVQGYSCLQYRTNVELIFILEQTRWISVLEVVVSWFSSKER
jgi:hypothetical protein